MIFLYINDVLRSDDYVMDSLRVFNEIQQRADTCDFVIFQNTAPVENQGVDVYKGDTVESAAGATIVLSGYYENDVKYFHTGQQIHVRIGDSDDELATIQSYTESTNTIVLTAAPSGTVSAGDKVGIKIFGGIVKAVKNYNVTVKENLEYDVECIDYSKVFDKKLIADSWEDRDSRYIINDFCNNHINLNHLIDQLDYVDDAAIQAEWTEGGSGSAAVTDDVDPYEADHWGEFETTTGAIGTWTTSPASTNISGYTGTASGAPVSGKLGFWLKLSDVSAATRLRIFLGSGTTQRIYTTALTAIIQRIAADNTPVYIELDLADDFTIQGTPDWTAFDYFCFDLEGSSALTAKISGFRFLPDNYIRHYPYVESTPNFDDLRANQMKPTSLIQLMTKTWQYNWWIDYERYIHFVDSGTEGAPFQLTAAGDNYTDLQIDVDQSQIGNRVIVRGGEKTSDSYYQQVFEGDDAVREWLLKNKFSSLTITVDNNTTTLATIAGTTTTTIVFGSAHGLADGDHITNRSRGNAVREVVYVNATTVTVEAITAQTNGDTISFFSVSKTAGIEGLNDPTLFEYLYSSQEKSVRAATDSTLTAAEFIRFQYKERVPIQLQYRDSASVNALKALGFGDGIYDLDPIYDKNIDSVNTALVYAEAKVGEFSNPIITGSFVTDNHGLRAGQVIQIADPIRGIDQDFVIQKTAMVQRAGKYNDNFVYNISFGTTLFGIIEFFQKLLSIKDKIEVNSDEVVETFISSDEFVDCADVNSVLVDSGGDERASIAETVEASDVNNVDKTTQGDWEWEPSTGQPLESRWDLFSWG